MDFNFGMYKCIIIRTYKKGQKKLKMFDPGLTHSKKQAQKKAFHL
jgi:hypothetical protein